MVTGKEREATLKSCVVPELERKKKRKKERKHYSVKA